MAKHEIVIHENTSSSKASAPYFGSYVTKETIHQEKFVATLAAYSGLQSIQVLAILLGAFDAIERLEAESLTRVNLDGFTVCGVITGSFPTSDAAFDAKRNKLQLALRLDDEIRLVLANEVPAIIGDEALTKLRIDNVMDLAEPRPYNVIHGKHAFRVAGFNMMLTDEGAAAFLQDAMGTTFDLTIDAVDSHQLFKAHTAELLEPGDYKLVVKSRAGVAEGPLQTSFRKVKYLKVVDPEPIDPPEIVSANSSDEPDGRVNPLQDVQIQGRHLAGGSVQLVGADGTVKYCAPSATGDDETLTAPLNYTGDKSELARVQVTTAGGTASIEVRFV